MAQLKRWESPRRSGRNDKGKGGSARARQLRKQQQQLRQTLKSNSAKTEGGRKSSLVFYGGKLRGTMEVDGAQCLADETV